MTEIKSTDFHVDYSDVHRHWHSGSETYTGSDALITALENGWRLTDPIYEEHVWHAGTRLVVIYHAFLQRGDEEAMMSIVANPFIRRGLKNKKWQMLSYEDLQRRSRPSRQRV